VCVTLQFNDDWTPEHLTGGPTNLYKEMDLALKGEEWRQPGLVALATKLATSAGEHVPIDVFVPKSYEPKTGPNPWVESVRGRCEAAAEPESTNSTGHHAASRMPFGGAAVMMGSPRLPAEISLPQAQALPEFVAAEASSRSSQPKPKPDEIELASMPMAVRNAPPTSGLTTVPQPAAATSTPLNDFLSYRFRGIFSHPEASERLDA